MAFDEVLRARVERDIKARLARLARQPEHRGRDESDLLRIAVEDYCNAEEKRLRMKPITPEEVDAYYGLLLAERHTPSPRRPREPVNYRRLKQKPARLGPDQKS